VCSQISSLGLVALADLANGLLVLPLVWDYISSEGDSGWTLLLKIFVVVTPLTSSKPFTFSSIYTIACHMSC